MNLLSNEFIKPALIYSVAKIKPSTEYRAKNKNLVFKKWGGNLHTLSLIEKLF
ncbi:hypothetical protein KVL16_06605 [Helicobacter pylori]|nr:hypothetical protein KVL16_06605 [Helicobacter pylori]